VFLEKWRKMGHFRGCLSIKQSFRLKKAGDQANGHQKLGQMQKKVKD
jgi:hypothetical protein